jgi:glycosyltransferase involved in cell wall biosynthesis
VSAVAVIVPAADAAGTIGATLAALADQDVSEPYEVVVVDDGSTDGTAHVAERAGGPVRVLRQERLGASIARNRGVEATRAPLLAFTDADCVPTRGWLRAGVGALARAELVQGAVGSDPAVEAGPFDRSLWVTHETGFYETASLFVRRSTFERVGGFEPLFPDADRARPMGEDTWFGWRARRAGARTEFCPEALVHHEVLRRGARDYVAERLRLTEFPALAKRIPELRAHNFFARWFLSRRSAAFDAALASAAAARATRSRAPLAGALPYAALVWSHARPWEERAAGAAAAGIAADAVGFAALARGSARARSLLI